MVSEQQTYDTSIDVTALSAMCHVATATNVLALLVICSNACCVLAPCPSPPEGFWSARSYEQTISFSRPTVEGYAVMQSHTPVENVYTGRMVMYQPEFQAVPVGGLIHAIYDPEVCELYGIDYVSSVGDQLYFAYKFDGVSRLIGLDHYRLGPLPHAPQHGMHVFDYEGPANCTPM